jgi:hypothetical protein
MKPLLFQSLLALALLPICYGQYSEQVLLWPHVRLQLSQEVTVGDLFAAGLRAYSPPHFPKRCIHAKHAHIRVVDRDGRAYPSIPADILRTEVQKPWLITSMDIWTPPLTIKEARAEMLKWLPMTSKSGKELEDFLRAVEADWLHYDVVNGYTDVVRFVDGWTDADGLDKTVVLMKSWQWQAPLRLCFKLNTSGMKSRKPIELYAGPIPPPPGFEGADMKAPKDWEADDKFIALTTEPRPAQGTLPPKYQAMNDKAQAEAAAQKSSPSIQYPAPKKATEAKPAPAPSEGPTSSTPWSVIVVLIVAATGLLWLLLKGRK